MVYYREIKLEDITLLSKINHKIIHLLYSLNEHSKTVRLMRALYCTILEVNSGYLNLHAKSLVYTTLVSLVPVLAISFSLLQYFGVHNQAAPMLDNILKPLGEKGQEIGLYIINFIDNVDIGLLGTVGTIILLYTVISTIIQIEETLNHIWKTSTNRSWLRRIFYYLTVITFAPSLVFIGLFLTASLTNTDIAQSLLSIEPFGTLYLTIATITPYISAIIAFTLVYKFLPNTYVSFYSALIGGLSATLVWKGVGFGFAVFIRNSSNYDLIYSGFAALIIFLFWIYISWLIFLLGGQLSYSFQNVQVFRRIATQLDS